MSIKRTMSMLCLAVIAASCQPPQAYAQADRDCYNAVAPEYRAYVEQDIQLTEQQKMLRYRTLDVWKLRLDAAGGVK